MKLTIWDRLMLTLVTRSIRVATLDDVLVGGQILSKIELDEDERSAIGLEANGGSLAYKMSPELDRSTEIQLDEEERRKLFTWMSKHQGWSMSEVERTTALAAKFADLTSAEGDRS